LFVEKVAGTSGGAMWRRRKLRLYGCGSCGKVGATGLPWSEIIPVFSKTCIYLEHLGFFSSQWQL